MRKTLFSLALAMAVLSSCSSDDIVNNPMNEENHSFPASRSLHENILSFSSEEEYNALLDSLGTLSDEELLQWESGQKGFTSMYRMHSEALGQILNATCKEEYESIKTAYQTDFIFIDKDSTDLSIYMPVLNVSKAITLPPEGFVCIAGERKNMKEFENYDGYKKELSLLYPVPLGVTIENGINRVYVKTKKRKFTAQIGMRGNQQAIRVNASKKVFKIPVEKRKLLFERSILHPEFNIDRENFGKLMMAIEKEWKISLKKEEINLLSIRDITTIYDLLKRTEINEDFKK